MKVQAQARNLHISAQKLRLSINGLRGQTSLNAMQYLSAQPQKGAVMAFDVVKSAVANAEHNHNALRTKLVIDEVRVDQATKLKRWRPRSRGMTAPIEHQRAHLTVVLSDLPSADIKKSVKNIEKTDKTSNNKADESAKVKI